MFLIDLINEEVSMVETKLISVILPQTPLADSNVKEVGLPESAVMVNLDNLLERIRRFSSQISI